MGEKEQVKPLAPASHRIHVEEENESLSMEMKRSNPRKYIKCCGCITAILLIQAVIILVLVFTVFHVKDPKIKMNSIKIEDTNFRRGTNVTVIADVSIKNPNVASFKFKNATTNIYYDDKVIGEARTPPGIIKARRTLRMNLTMDVMVDRILDVLRQGQGTDLGVEGLPVSSYTKICGKVKILKIIRKNVVVTMNCTMTVDIKSQSINDQNCESHVSL
ncbi:hypothetical protein ACH5RR_041652 [Cinchona calisaya]|uniref:Late embryogenesis abundant protein LEA-2 subgroup domain-containing protein n=1 Tax=Cinchona calisaya TaxID=153742 RepID=A0ABD2XXD2_9GENT